jgi:hypothetical protein
VCRACVTRDCRIRRPLAARRDRPVWFEYAGIEWVLVGVARRDGAVTPVSVAFAPTVRGHARLRSWQWMPQGVRAGYGKYAHRSMRPCGPTRVPGVEVHAEEWS